MFKHFVADVTWSGVVFFESWTAQRSSFRENTWFCRGWIGIGWDSAFCESRLDW